MVSLEKAKSRNWFPADNSSMDRDKSAASDTVQETKSERGGDSVKPIKPLLFWWPLMESLINAVSHYSTERGWRHPKNKKTKSKALQSAAFIKNGPTARPTCLPRPCVNLLGRKWSESGNAGGDRPMIYELFGLFKLWIRKWKIYCSFTTLVCVFGANFVDFWWLVELIWNLDGKCWQSASCGTDYGRDGSGGSCVRIISLRMTYSRSQINQRRRDTWPWWVPPLRDIYFIAIALIAVCSLIDTLQ